MNKKQKRDRLKEVRRRVKLKRNQAKLWSCAGQPASWCLGEDTLQIRLRQVLTKTGEIEWTWTHNSCYKE